MESPGHIKINNSMQKKFNEWFPGVKIKEYNFWGQRVDFFYINYQGITITVEVIWRRDKQGFLEDFDIIQNSLGQIKLVIVNLDRMKRLQLDRYFDKIRIAEIRKGFIISEPFDGNKILKKNEKIYFEYIKEFIEFSLTLIMTDQTKMDYLFSDIKKYVVGPLYEYIKQNETIPYSLEECEIDQGLFTDFMDNHYLGIKKIWNETKTLGSKSGSVKKNSIKELKNY
jgi:hypothetical protein